MSYQLRKVWETFMTFDFGLLPTDMNINKNYLFILHGQSTYQYWSVLGNAFFSYSFQNLWDASMMFDLDLT